MYKQFAFSFLYLIQPQLCPLSVTSKSLEFAHSLPYQPSLYAVQLFLYSWATIFPKIVYPSSRYWVDCFGDHVVFHASVFVICVHLRLLFLFYFRIPESWTVIDQICLLLSLAWTCSRESQTQCIRNFSFCPWPDSTRFLFSLCGDPACTPSFWSVSCPEYISPVLPFCNVPRYHQRIFQMDGTDSFVDVWFWHHFTLSTPHHRFAFVHLRRTHMPVYYRLFPLRSTPCLLNIATEGCLADLPDQFLPRGLPSSPV